jgi:hypothetical protein
VTFRISGYFVIIVAERRKVFAATVAALAALVGGVEVASAGILDPVTETPPPVVVPPPPVVEEVVPEVDEVVAVTGQATETAGQVTETAGQVTQPVTETVGNAREMVDQVANGTPVGKVLDEVERIVAPVVEKPLPKVLGIGQSPATRAAEPGSAAAGGANPSGLAMSPAGATSAPSLPLGIDPITGSAGLLQVGPDGTPVSPIGHFGESASGSGSALTPLELLVSGSAQATSDGVARASRAEDSPGLPWPFSPGFPVDTAAVAAFLTGAAGGALIAALLAAFMFMAPSAGRWLRPGPTLGWPSPAVPSLERPG